MRRIVGAALALAMVLSMTLIASAATGSVEVRGHIVGAGRTAQYRVTYHANGGRGSCTGPQGADGGADTVCSLSGTGITRSGYRFTGWNTREDGRGISYAAGDRITLDGDVTLYAQWRKITGGGGRAPWSAGTTTLDDGAVPASDDAANPGGGKVSFNPGTGVERTMPLYGMGLLCILLAMAIFLLRAGCREKGTDAREPCELP